MKYIKQQVKILSSKLSLSIKSGPNNERSGKPAICRVMGRQSSWSVPTDELLY